MFQFSGFAHLSVYYVFNIVGCPIQVFTDRIVCANPRSFSQLITPFIASESLGIPHTPLFCLLYFFFSYELYVISYESKLTIHNSQFTIKKCSFYFLNFFLSQYVNELFRVDQLIWLFVNLEKPNNRITKLPNTLSVVENNGVEPLTSCVQGRRSSQLS
jgi:hypothetical protein